MQLRIGRDFIPGQSRRALTSLKKWEILFFVLGALTLGTFVIMKTYSWAYQAYTDYVFDEQIQHRTPSLEGFLSRLWRPAHPPASHPPDQRDAARQALQNEILAPVIPNAREWSKDRLREYKTAPPPAPGAVLGRLQIPSVDLSVMILQGSDDLTLDRAVGHIDGTALPGQRGNVGIAGHRDGFFRGLKDLSKNDPVELTTLNGKLQYRVSDIKIVKPEDTAILAPSDKAMLTLVTCYPFYYMGPSPKRYIVVATLVENPKNGEKTAEKQQVH